MIKLENLTFYYPESETPALDHVSMELKAGGFYVLCGQSGCGKSTILRHLKSVLTPEGRREGSIRYRGIPLEEVDQRTQSEKIGYVMQNPDNQLVTDKVWHELAFGLESLGLPSSDIRLRVAEMASYFGIQTWFHRKVNELSGGQKQLLNLAAVMAMRPEVLILDEPTSQLDPIAAGDFLSTVRRINRDLGTMVIITEHRLEEVLPWADKVFVMDGGKLLTEGKALDVARFLKKEEHPMFQAMPAPVRICAEMEPGESWPLTVREGKEWLKNFVEKYSKGGEKENRIPPEVPGEELAISVKNINFRYEKNLPDVVTDLCMEVKKGEFFALVGGNGTGKSTTLSLLAGIQKTARGTIRYFGKDIRKIREKELYTHFLGVLPQDPQSVFLKSTVRQELYEVKGDLPESMSRKEAVDGIAALTGMEKLLDRHPYDLSGGEQERLALAKVLLMRPKILLMDEPTKGLDAFYKQELGKILKKLCAHGVTILMVSHDLDFCADFADRVGLFFDGSVITEKPVKEFFAGNNFYTTKANQMAREYFPEAVTVKDVVECLQNRK